MSKKNISIVFLSNYFNHHQIALSDALWSICEGNYTFVETNGIPQVRKKLGYTVQNRPYVLSLSGNEDRIKQLVKEADVVIAGSARKSLVKERIDSGKLLLCYSERPLKKGFEWKKYIPRLILWHWRNPFWKPIYLLCASAYTAQDYRMFGLFRNKAYKWGYFPETKRYADEDKLISSKDSREILWCGRFLELKHPEHAITVARRLKADGYDFCMKFIGTGVLESQLRQAVQEFHLEDCVHFLGTMTPAQVRIQMEKAGIYLFTSDRREGWGAVLNESMNSGCAVVASHAVGSAPYLVEDGENGLLYASGDVQMLYEKVKYLLERPEEQKRLGKAAYQTITEVWNAETAAERLLELAESLLKKERSGSPFLTGPCSRAD